ncbi:MAG: glutamine--fructose-6-phosphate transaminase (isomerizing) [Pseudomonadota bacterium]|nr:glutamine--fructose-6-phosphate transaminase (isomerizing) [Gammaproteobacteria bacterium]MEE2684267.1 glutamine--fructose-6-phosphate transaminase (isomerizing) [Pseudomonadota bacterium]
MCGIVGAVAGRNVTPILMEGLRKLEYRGYDSAGLSVIGQDLIHRVRREGKLTNLESAISKKIKGQIGIAHTRWATHGKPSEDNAQPHNSSDRVSIVHNGIIENYEDLKSSLIKKGFSFKSETDSEVIAHLIVLHLEEGATSLLDAVRKMFNQLEGAFAIVAIDKQSPDSLVVVRSGCPVVIGNGIKENFIASDVSALLPVTRQFQFLEEGDIALVNRHEVQIFNALGKMTGRPVLESGLTADSTEKGEFRHFMQKEIHEQGVAIENTLSGRVNNNQVVKGILGERAEALLKEVKAVHIIACGTSYHAGLVARQQIEELAGLPCMVDIASEHRYRKPAIPDNTLMIVISQSGETADTLAAHRVSKDMGYLASLAICNVAESSLVRESDLALLTKAGVEVGVASTKAFTTQLVALQLITILMARNNGLTRIAEKELVKSLVSLPSLVDKTLTLEGEIELLAEQFADKHHALFLGRGALNPIAMEGALKLKEISYIHAEAYAAGELKHGPLALVDDDMPVVSLAPNDELLEKLKSNLQEVRVRGGQLFVFADKKSKIKDEDGLKVIRMPTHSEHFQAPILYTIPLQLLAYYVSLLKGTDVDQPRNLAKSVTVE